MSDTEQFGQSRALSDAGFTPLKIHREKLENPPPSESDALSVRDAAAELAANRAADQKPRETRTFYEDENPDRPVAFADAETAHEVRQASKAQYAEEHIKPEQEAQAQALRDRIDAARGEPSQAQLEQDAKAKAEESNRQHREMMEKIATHYQAEQAQAQERQLANARETLAARGMAIAAQLSSEFPEIANLSRAQIPGAVEALRARNPQRAQALVQRLQTVDKLYQDAHRVSAASAQHANAQHETYVRQENAAFHKAIASDSAQRQEQVMAGVETLLTEAGIDPKAYVQSARQGGDLGRLLASAPVLKLLYRAAAAAIDGKSHSSTVAELKAKLARDVPPVSRPGNGTVPSRPLSGAAMNSSKLNATLRAGGDNALKAAAAALMARRSGRTGR
jgi:hypothetical protein